MSEQPGDAAVASDDELDAALKETGYRYRDPVVDPHFRRITAPDPDRTGDVFPEGWGSEPTARDQAAIDAGNAV